MTSRDAAEAEIRALMAEAIGGLRLISESSGSLTQRSVRTAIAEAVRQLYAAENLADRLP
jgi:hypothetical protein